MSAHDARLVPSALAGFGACVALFAGAPWPLLVFGLALTTAAAAAIVAFRARPRRGTGVEASRARLRQLAVHVALAAAIGSLLAIGAQAQMQLRMSSVAMSAIATGSPVVVVAVVSQEARPASPDRFTGQPNWEAIVNAIAVDGTACKAPIRVVTARPDGLELGAAVHLEGALDASPQPRFAAVMWGAQVVHADSPVGIGAWVGEARDALRRATEGLPGEVRGLTRGMVIGDDSDMPTSQRDDMRRASLAHLTAVSGSHFAIVTVLAMWLLRRMRLGRKFAAMVLATVTGGFALLVGPEPSVVRAVAMAAAIALALAWGRPARAVAALSAGTVLILAIDPFVAAALGFQLSVAAVASIVLWAPHLAQRLQRWMTAPLAHAIAVPTAAASVTAPFLVGLSGGVAAFAVPANLVAGPFAAPVTVLGLSALGASRVTAAGSEALANVAGAAARPVAWAARAFAHAPGSWIEWPGGPASGLALGAIVALAIAATTSRRVKGWGLIAALVAVVVLAVAGPRLTATPVPALPDWDVVACDVGQGDMILLRSGPSSAVVIDAGPPEADVVGCLDRHGVGQVDLLILTHPHRDHEGAMPQILSHVHVDQAWLSPAASGGDAAARLKAAGVPVHFAVAGDGGTWGKVRLRVLAPVSGDHWSDDDLNDSSIVVMAQAGGARVLALGDIETAGQTRLAELLAPVVVDVVKVAHHGSAEQLTALAQRITARVAIVSVGASNTYGHPSASALDLYGSRATTVQRTDECGDIAVAVGEGVQLSSRCEAAGGDSP